GHFSVTVGTVFERSHVPLHKWLLATHLLTSSKKGISAHQLHRTLGVTYKTAWFMAHRIREAMKEANPEPMGGGGQPVEADETFTGPSGYEFTSEKGWAKKAGTGDKYKVVTLVERDGRARSFHVKSLKARNLRPILVRNVKRSAQLITDEASHYKAVGREFRSHHSVNHSVGEWKRGKTIHTNTVEGYFSIFKRGMRGIYQHCGEQHLQRYLTEFDFRYSHRKVDDQTRAVFALKGIHGKRLTYRRTRLHAEEEAHHARAIQALLPPVG
ncbi:MAG: IS1595 family transposase, partial [Alphaproteobacteria bacterium]|nr:IS1595 family transposase [Alphaproteobacteria bacterium]